MNSISNSLSAGNRKVRFWNRFGLHFGTLWGHFTVFKGSKGIPKKNRKQEAQNIEKSGRMDSQMVPDFENFRHFWISCWPLGSRGAPEVPHTGPKEPKMNQNVQKMLQHRPQLYNNKNKTLSQMCQDRPIVTLNSHDVREYSLKEIGKTPDKFKGPAPNEIKVDRAKPLLQLNEEGKRCPEGKSSRRN